MNAISPLWWARTLGIVTFCAVIAVRYQDGTAYATLLESAVWSMLLASILGFGVGRVLQMVVGALESGGVPPQTGQIDAEMPGTMPPLS